MTSMLGFVLGLPPRKSACVSQPLPKLFSHRLIMQKVVQKTINFRTLRTISMPANQENVVKNVY